MNKIQFSVLSYHPSLATNENINIGILFHNLTTDERNFYMMNNWKRLENFDDELDVDFMKDYLAGMKKECEINLFNSQNQFCLKEYIKIFVNELKFSKVQEMEVLDAEGFISQTEKIYMRFDLDKKNRLSRNDEVNYLKKLIRGRDIDFTIKPVTGRYDENIKFDYIIGNYCFKIFTFKGKDKQISRLISNAKLWSYNAESLQNKFKIVFIYDIELANSREYNIVMDILKENAKDIISSDQFADYLLELHSA